MNYVMSAIEDTVSISLFNRGLAGKIFTDVRRTGAKVVMKNNAPECVLLSPEEYVQLMEQVNDTRLLNVVAERMDRYNPNNTISSEEMNRRLGMTDADLENFDEVNLE